MGNSSSRASSPSSASAAAAAAASEEVISDSTLRSLSFTITPDARVPLVYSPAYNISFWNLEKLHPFDAAKYEKVHRALTGPLGLVRPDEIFQPIEVPRSVLRLPRFAELEHRGRAHPRGAPGGRTAKQPGPEQGAHAYALRHSGHDPRSATRHARVLARDERGSEGRLVLLLLLRVQFRSPLHLTSSIPHRQSRVVDQPGRRVSPLFGAVGWRLLCVRRHQPRTGRLGQGRVEEGHDRRPGCTPGESCGRRALFTCCCCASLSTSALLFDSLTHDRCHVPSSAG
jgi:hypothetical protein